MKWIFFIIIAVLFIGCGKKSTDEQTGISIRKKQYEPTAPVLFVVNGKAATIELLQSNNLSASGKILLPGNSWPHHIYKSPDASKLAVVLTSNDLSGGHSGGHDAHGEDPLYATLIIDAKEGTLLKSWKHPSMPHNAIFSPDGKQLWIGQSTGSSSILVYNTADWSLLKEISAGKELSEITFSPDGSKAYAANTGDGTLQIITTADFSTRTTIAVGSGPVGAWPGNENWMLLDLENSKELALISIQGDSISEKIKLNYTPAYAAYEPKLGEIWISDASNGGVRTYKKAAGNWQETGFISTGADAHAVLFDPAFQYAYISNQKGNTVTKIDVAAKRVIHTQNVGDMPNGMTLIP